MQFLSKFGEQFLALPGVIPKAGGQSSSLREMARDGYLFSFVGQSAVAVEKQ